jgi:beta-mannanase
MQAAVVVGALVYSGLFSTPSEAQTSYQTLNYLYSIKGQKTLSGQHNKEPNSNPSQYTAQVNAVTGDYPALWSGDFLFASADISNRGTMINQAMTEWQNGAVVNLMWHACLPAVSEPCTWNGVWTTLSDTQWNQLITNGTALNNTWKARMDAVAAHLQTLENAGVEVLFRPLHEMNQGGFWWGGRPGPNGTAKLFQITRDYFKYTKGLSNLIWVWDMQDFSGWQNQSGAPGSNSYNPGSSYWDVFALDVYWTDGTGFTKKTQRTNLGATGSKGSKGSKGWVLAGSIVGRSGSEPEPAENDASIAITPIATLAAAAILKELATPISEMK